MRNIKKEMIFSMQNSDFYLCHPRECGDPGKTYLQSFHIIFSKFKMNALPGSRNKSGTTFLINSLPLILITAKKYKTNFYSYGIQDLFQDLFCESIL